MVQKLIVLRRFVVSIYDGYVRNAARTPNGRRKTGGTTTISVSVEVRDTLASLAKWDESMDDILRRKLGMRARNGK